MEKIKNWKTGDEPDPLLVPFVQPIFLEKMASPFATEKEKAAVAAENAKLKAAEMGEEVGKSKSLPVKSAKPQPSPALRAGQPLPSPRIAARGQQHQPVPPLAQGVIKLSGGDDVPPETGMSR